MPGSNVNSHLDKNDSLPVAKGRTVLFAALIITLFALAVAWPMIPHIAGDAGWYERLADGRADEVPRPFANRMLAPWLAARLASATGGSIDTGFRLLGIASLAIFIAALTRLLIGTRWGWRLPVAVLCTPFTILLFREYYLVDLPHTALVALALFALARKSALVVVVLLAASLVRESTLIFAIVLGILAWRDGNRRLALSVVIASAVGAALAWLWSGGTAHANVHGIGALPYLVFKVPFNFLGNVFGVVIWVNTIHTTEPMIAWNLPSWLALGSVSSVGIAGVNFLRPLYMAAYALSLFGLAPTFAWRAWRRGALTWSTSPLWRQAALVYGLLIFFAMPVSGSSLPRLLGYGWPALLVAIPLIVAAPGSGLLPRRHLGRLLALHMGCAWLTAIGTVIEHAVVPGLVMLALAICCHVAAKRTITQ